MSLPGLKSYNGFLLPITEEKFYVTRFMLSLQQYFLPFSLLLFIYQPHQPITHISSISDVCFTFRKDLDPLSQLLGPLSQNPPLTDSFFSFWAASTMAFLERFISDGIVSLSHYVQIFISLITNDNSSNYLLMGLLVCFLYLPSQN